MWNILIATVLWETIFKDDKKIRNDIKTRAFVLAFGVGYALVGAFPWMWFIIVAGIAGKAFVVLDYFGNRFDFNRPKITPLTFVVIGDLLWAFAFGAILGFQLSSKRRGL